MCVVIVKNNIKFALKNLKHFSCLTTHKVCVYCLCYILWNKSKNTINYIDNTFRTT